jgi:hypothetical protein
MFVVPAIVFGLGLSIPALVLCYRYAFDETSGDGFSPFPSWVALLFAAFVGILIPILSSIIPIMRVLGQNLNDALNYERSRIKAVNIEILDNSKTHILPMIVFGLISVAFGVAIYYLLPLSLLSFNLGLLL